MLSMNLNCYLLHLAGEQIKITASKQKIDKLLQKKKLDQKTLEKLALVQTIRNYAVSHLYLNPSGGYIYYARLKRKKVGWNVSASYPLQFKSYTWWFPVAGTVPYKGFFQYNMAKKEELRLQKLGLDTRIRETGAYSTLGWFSDPILSPHLEYPLYELAELIIHEMAHATVYIKGDSNFNESYATFVEEEGVRRFLVFLEGKNSPTLKKMEKENETATIVRQIIQKTGKQLENLYNSAVDDSQKLKRKQEIIQDFKNQVVRKNILSSAKSLERFKKKEFNNEDFIGYLRYNSGTKFFKQELARLGGDIAKFHVEMKKLETLELAQRARLISENNTE